MSRQISPAEVAQHNTEKDCWIIVKGKVYDVSKYLNDHPGGVDIVTELAGKDATEDYADVGHTQEADDILSKFMIGTLNASAAPAPAAAAAPVAAAPVAAAPKPVAAPTIVAPKAQPQAQPKKVVTETGSDNSALMIGGVVIAVAAAAFFLLKKSKE